MEKIKTCLWCQRELPKTEYHMANDRKDGLQEICKLCNKYRTMYAAYGRKEGNEIKDMIKERKVRILLMELKMNGTKPRDAVSMAVQTYSK